MYFLFKPTSRQVPEYPTCRGNHIYMWLSSRPLESDNLNSNSGSTTCQHYDPGKVVELM